MRMGFLRMAPLWLATVYPIMTGASILVMKPFAGVPPPPRFPFILVPVMEGLGFLDSWDDPLSRAKAVSGDGAVIVGISTKSYWNDSCDCYEDSLEAFRWTRKGGMEGLGHLSVDGYIGYSEALGASEDGTVVVGSSSYSGGTFDDRHAFRWTSSGSMDDLGTLRGYKFSEATSVFAGGDLVVGGCWDEDSFSRVTDMQAFYWTKIGGMQGLGFLAVHDASEAKDVSANGQVIVGTSMGAENEEAFRWTRKFRSMNGLGDLPGGAFRSRAHGVSDDGSVVVGVGNMDDGDRAFIWNGKGMRNLEAVLVGLGLDLDGWILTGATDVSADGKTIVGYGINPEGHSEAWIANIAKNPYLSLRPPGEFQILP